MLIAVGVVAALVVIVAQRDDSGGESAGGLTGGDFHSLVVDPADPDRIFVGGHQAVSVSTDGGATWAEVEALRDADAMGWSFTDDAVYVSGHPGLNLSTDDASTFERVNDGLPDTDVHAFGAADGVLYGATPSAGVMSAPAGSREWEVRSGSVGQSFFGRLLVGPDDPDRILAADAAAGVAESRDGGRSWELLSSGLPAATWISRGGADDQVVVASGPTGASMSPDGGATWAPLDIPEGVTLVEAVPGVSDLLYAGRHDGSAVDVLVSRDGGTTWTEARA
ncbi:hypothetical protein PO878_04660 [Iamia majanohamensis]|uniref:Exo-alpha-sialidase n=1 Tax=Iamia majanohamensis TaxID=467976 RepID=A0AAE9Y789_9ACTN|nr:hypothetical protein [Iamia majanohamensis]WCO68014.1 hypothetical protein PO878_04660 [Iamia majanohamensis]